MDVPALRRGGSGKENAYTYYRVWRYKNIVQREVEEEEVRIIALLLSHLLQPPAQGAKGVWFERWKR